MRVTVPIIGGFAKDKSVTVNAQETVNLFARRTGPDAKAPMVLMGCEGTVDFCDLSSSVQIRNMRKVNDYLYAVGGNTLYKIDTDGTETAISGTLSTSEGHVYMEHDGTNLMIVDPGVEGYTYDTVAGGNLTAIADADFPTPGTLTWQDGYFIVSEDGTKNFYISAAYDPTSWDALDYDVVQAKPDKLKRSFSDHLNLWQFGEEYTEVWYQSGASDFPFDRYGNLLLSYGTEAPGSVAAGDNAIFWLTDQRQAVRADGFQPVIVSNRALESEWSTYTDVSDAKGFCYTSTEGQAMYVLIFPTGNATWVYDVETKLWHQRKSWPLYVDGYQYRHRCNCYAYFAGKNLIGDYANGKIYEWDINTYEDSGSEIIRRTRVTQMTHAQRYNMIFYRFELEMESGVGLASGQGSDPQVMLSWSDDGGHTWSNEHWRSVGKIGEYKKRIVWNRLGRSRDRRFKIGLSDPIKCIILAAYADIEILGG